MMIGICPAPSTRLWIKVWLVRHVQYEALLQLSFYILSRDYVFEIQMMQEAKPHTQQTSPYTSQDEPDHDVPLRCG